MTPQTYKFDIDSPSEYAAGLRGFTDTVSVTVDSGNPGGEPGEFQEAMRTFLSEWYNNARVTHVTTKETP